MNKILKTNHLSERNQELIDQYEKLRAEALDRPQVISNRHPGFSILFLRGIASWIEACLCFELPQPCSSKTIHDHQTMGSILLPHLIHKEATVILTNIILSHQKQTRNNYV